MPDINTIIDADKFTNINSNWWREGREEGKIVKMDRNLFRPSREFMASHFTGLEINKFDSIVSIAWKINMRIRLKLNAIHLLFHSEFISSMSVAAIPWPNEFV